MPRRILFVHGLGAETRARDLAYEFEQYIQSIFFCRFGRISRCDIPAPRYGSASRSLYAFVEFEDWRAAEAAYHRLHGKPFGSGIIKIQWAKSARRPSLTGGSGGGRMSMPPPPPPPPLSLSGSMPPHSTTSGPWMDSKDTRAPYPPLPPKYPSHADNDRKSYSPTTANATNTTTTTGRYSSNRSRSPPAIRRSQSPPTVTASGRYETKRDY